MPFVKLNGKQIEVAEQMSVAAALMNHGIVARKSVSGEMRGPLCGMGICFECRVVVDGVAHVRGCQVMVREGMEVWTDAG